ncbi:hypothetical protein [Pelagibaculum spongiae]|uniref:Lipoprotein n=1 Tax=Pelagibaculum spongiae TaxID=2080658 RepID=A0A2V1H0U1_9GAMM|nr:hypothetical protein [Pelagibaculum spongiae]PVZ69693.1 hypothetical protein DC094_10355 [Pelagibaculum spongiae]
MKKSLLLILMFFLNGCATYAMWKIDEKEENSFTSVVLDPVIAGYYHSEKNEFLLLGLEYAYLFEKDRDFNSFQPIYDHVLPYRTSFSKLSLGFNNNFNTRVTVTVAPDCYCKRLILDEIAEKELVRNGFMKNALGYYELDLRVSGKRFDYDKDELDAAYLDVGFPDISISYDENNNEYGATLTKISLTPFMLKKDLSLMASTNPYLLAVFYGVVGLTVWVVEEFEGGIVPP